MNVVCTTCRKPFETTFASAMQPIVQCEGCLLAGQERERKERLCTVHAADLWPLMFAHGMPPNIALELSDEKTEAGAKMNAEAIISTATRWLMGLRPGSKALEKDDNNPLAVTAGRILVLIQLGQFFTAGLTLGQFHAQIINRLILTGPFTVAEHDLAQTWQHWVEDARRTIDLCSAVAAEATAQANQEQPK